MKLGNVTSVNGKNGDVTVTPENIGALPTTGGTVTGRSTFAQGIKNFHLESVTANAGYVIACTFIINGNYPNSPLQFDVIDRSMTHNGTIYIKWGNSSDPSLEEFSYSGKFTGNPIIHKSAPKTWDVYLHAQPWYVADIINLTVSDYQLQQMDILWKNKFVTVLPTDYIVASLKTIDISVKMLSGMVLKNYYEIPEVRSDGVMNIGKYIDFYNGEIGKTETSFQGRITCANDVFVFANGQYAHGTLVAKTFDGTATKATADGSGNIITDTYALKQMFTSDNYGTRILNPDGSGLLWHTFSNEIRIGSWEGTSYFAGLDITAYSEVGGKIKPCADNDTDLGFYGKRWKQIYSVTSTISTSDENEKKDIENLNNNQTIDFIMGLQPKSFKFINGESGRTHTGLIAQDVEELLKMLGMSTLDFTGFIKSPKTKTVEKEIEREVEKDGEIVVEKTIVSEEEIIEGEYIYGLRYEEFISPLIKVTQILWEKVTNLEEKVTMLEEENIILKKENVELKEKMQNIESRLEKLEIK